MRMNNQNKHIISFIERYKSQELIFKIVWPVCVVVFFILIGLSFSVYLTATEMNSHSADLINVSYYSLDQVKSNNSTKNILKDARNLPDLVRLSRNAEEENTRLNAYFDSLQQPYKSFLQYFLLPPLNIWEDPYTKAIDTKLIGQRFLAENPFSDLALLGRWSDFFRVVGNGEFYNEITDISISPLQEQDNGYFSFELNVSFLAPNKRAFLFLINDLSFSSNRENISLVHEFVYNLREGLRISYQKTQTGTLLTGKSLDDFIARSLMDWVHGKQDISFLTEAVIENTIKKTVECNNEDLQYCAFLFRQKYQTVPSLAYSVGDLKNPDKKPLLKKFFQRMAPVMNIKRFTFTPQRKTLGQASQSYVGQIQFQIFGRGLIKSDYDRISLALAKQCFGPQQDLPLTVQLAKKTVDQAVVDLASISTLDTTKNKKLQELTDILNNYELTFDQLTYYNKTIKIFEIFRMLDDGRLCR
ncbi:MAG TPA: hypothetical protein PKC14_01050 [Candidatus Absconditabacterales bacterium]|nr:hypothetical protein [Candidatus Absconditabacterales bacterium]